MGTTVVVFISRFESISALIQVEEVTMIVMRGVIHTSHTEQNQLCWIDTRYHTMKRSKLRTQYTVTWFSCESVFKMEASNTVRVI